MFSYYGSKSKIVHLYPPPKYGTIIEPFAGSARYSLKYFDRNVIINDKYPVVYKMWKWLQVCSKQDILSLATPKLGQTIVIQDYDCEEAFLLMSFIIKSGTATPAYTVCKNRGELGQIDRIKRKIAGHLFKIRHWEVMGVDFSDLNNVEATWFIDPPYANGGEYYACGANLIDFPALADWCKSRKGQIIVCENTKATWLPFKPVTRMTGTMFTTTEAIWTNLPSSFNTVQQSLFKP